MKKRVLLFLIAILLVNLVSAAYDCSGTISTEKHIINLEQIESINGVNIALIDSFVVGAAEILIDARELTLTNESSSVNFTLADGYHEINLTRIANEFVWIKINGTGGEVEEKKVEEIEGLQVYVSSLEGTYPGADANAKLLVGDEYLFLYPANPADIKTIGGIEYLFEVSSSSGSEAMIEVKKCGGGDFTEVDEPVEQEQEDSGVEDSQEEPAITEIPDENASTENISGSDLQGKSFAQKITSPTVIIIIAIIVVVLIVIFILYMGYKGKGEEKIVPEKTNVSEESV